MPSRPRSRHPGTGPALAPARAGRSRWCAPRHRGVCRTRERRRLVGRKGSSLGPRRSPPVAASRIRSRARPPVRASTAPRASAPRSPVILHPPRARGRRDPSSLPGAPGQRDPAACSGDPALARPVAPSHRPVAARRGRTRLQSRAVQPGATGPPPAAARFDRRRHIPMERRRKGDEAATGRHRGLRVLLGRRPAAGKQPFRHVPRDGVRPVRVGRAASARASPDERTPSHGRRLRPSDVAPGGEGVPRRVRAGRCDRGHFSTSACRRGAPGRPGRGASPERGSTPRRPGCDGPAAFRPRVGRFLEERERPRRTGSNRAPLRTAAGRSFEKRRREGRLARGNLGGSPGSRLRVPPRERSSPRSARLGARAGAGRRRGRPHPPRGPAPRDLARSTGAGWPLVLPDDHPPSRRPPNRRKRDAVRGGREWRGSLGHATWSNRAGPSQPTRCAEARAYTGAPRERSNRFRQASGYRTAGDEAVRGSLGRRGPSRRVALGPSRAHRAAGAGRSASRRRGAQDRGPASSVAVRGAQPAQA